MPDPARETDRGRLDLDFYRDPAVLGELARTGELGLFTAETPVTVTVTACWVGTKTPRGRDDKNAAQYLANMLGIPVLAYPGVIGIPDDDSCPTTEDSVTDAEPIQVTPRLWQVLQEFAKKLGSL